ncbi:glutaredoxin domain-containing cysteine-rich protein 2 isoform X2 [Delphinapterus leucas]|uniref:Glutaredoxin domain-containing cysteine-rich protein 2 isoform X2 n=1 Tax=Delphinapterus leucas TaxID=9749 RepID=A0A2Y9PS26_DELLE|nr:glutaredoxin domain-containing cysteine-rich protein 2 isoform X2 [Delphinapterus leucas]XP_022445716.1 glutaredoxin domain-containing cysteine-rich protein 2 isoform X2 [Delphinapterus leucas]XP_022445717.1 glutaredoxin domain-containing cysteine-rich protein 2 isoform X2 [Delphinapterus leucas]XP_022445718.1 glutaredoxin domain-containing cysteine-rich protein 2 isoform X2 [Delphinapterus leucas]XP_030618628.1 glutaredoxin domain-containing cysteine-rich protein 2 isoform X2 [Delphinapteru
MRFQTLFEHFFLETAEVGLGLLEKPDWVQGWTGSDLNWTGSSVKPQFLVTRRSPAGTPHPLRGLQMASWENWQKPTRGKNPYQSQLAQISVVSAQERKSPPIIDFGKIIIYTNNLKIIRTPMDKRDFMRKMLQKEEEAEEESLMSKEEIYGDQNDGPLAETGGTFPHNQYPQEGELPEDNCFHCRGSGSATCSLCHGSKFSMLANRFKESYRALRCPACNENGLQPCQICNQ